MVDKDTARKRSADGNALRKRGLLPKRAVVERMDGNGDWRIVLLNDEGGFETAIFPDTQSATLALVRHVHSQFHQVLMHKLAIEDVPPPETYRITEIEEH